MELNLKALSQNPKAKKEYILKLIERGDKRSYNEIAADLELMLWRSR